MLHKLNSTYREIAKYFPELSGKISSSAQKKQILLEMAKRGDPRPWGTKLGNSLVGYTWRNSPSYDPVFTKDIKKIAPEWFVTKFTIAKQKKRQLLRMAKKGSPKPYHKTKLGQALGNYTRKASPSYDPVFTKDIKKIAPHWFVTKYDIVNDKKRQLLGMARKKLPLPMTKTEIGGALRSYTRKTSKSYCPIFDRKIRRAAPYWFTPQSEIADGKKQSLLELAKQGKPRPKQNTVLGKALVRFTSGSSRDPNFIKEIKKAAPQWFVTRSEIAHQKKLELMGLARQGKPRPNQKTHLGRALCNYICRTCGSYDPIFARKIKKLAAHWFKRKK
jgi:hypothetical protein